jgi:hypothetical protein
MATRLHLVHLSSSSSSSLNRGFRHLMLLQFNVIKNQSFELQNFRENRSGSTRAMISS